MEDILLQVHVPARALDDAAKYLVRQPDGILALEKAPYNLGRAKAGTWTSLTEIESLLENWTLRKDMGG